MREESRSGGVAVGNAARRRSGRISRKVGILLIGSNAEGTVFCEETHAVVLSLHGAGIVSRQRLLAEQELVMRIAATNREAEIRVVGEIAEEGDEHTYGVAFLDDKLDFWQMEFPPAPSWEERPETLTLQCSGCKELAEVESGDFAFDICTIHGGLPRFCDECGYLTVWRRSSELMPIGRWGGKGRESGEWRVGSGEKRLDAERWRSGEQRALEARGRPALPRSSGQVSDQEASGEDSRPTFTTRGRGTAEKKFRFEGANVPEMILPVAEDTGARAERRERVRAKVNFLACVRTTVFGDDVVRCLDMSKGGVSFKSEHCYQKDMKIEIAVPFAADVKGALAIFVRGRIANVREVEGMWRCGVEFLR